MDDDKIDYLVIGGGVIGLAVALELKRRAKRARVQLVEKELECGLHASGRNSGVLHAGFYYAADSMKARFCRDGNAELRTYIKRRDLPINQCGKLVVAKDEGDLAGLDLLYQRGKANGVNLEMISVDDARRIEPRVRTHERALWSPLTASADPVEVMKALTAEAELVGVEIRRGVTFAGVDEKGVRLRPSLAHTQRKDATPAPVKAGYVINCAGLYADRVARAFGMCRRYTILPFKGLYLYSDEAPGALKTLVYPVPDMAYPFLGVHFTVTVDGHAKIGPTAMPAFWRENYGGLANFRLGEMAAIGARELSLFIHAGFDFRGLAMQEMRKYSRKYLVEQGGKLLDGVRLDDYKRWGKPGIRAQLIDLTTRKLEMDFVLEGDAASLHVLNAVSPAWTCALPFARHVCDEAARLRGTGRLFRRPD